jgi:hypothetical protein
MLQKMGAEISGHPADMGPCIAVLREHDFEVEILDWVEDGSWPMARIMARIITDVTEDHFLSQVASLIEPFVLLDWPDDDPQQASA